MRNRWSTCVLGAATTGDGADGDGSVTTTETTDQPGPTATTTTRAWGGQTTTTPRRSVGSYVGRWQRHESYLTLGQAGGGTVLMGSSAVDVESWSLTWAETGGAVAGTLGSQTAKYGAGVDGLHAGGAFTARLSRDSSGTIVLITTGLGSGGGDLTWCQPAAYGNSPDCGA